MATKRKPNKLVLAMVGVVHISAMTLTWRNIRNRPARQVRGNKAIWRTASAMNTAGSAAYWIFGRKRAG